MMMMIHSLYLCNSDPNVQNMRSRQTGNTYRNTLLTTASSHTQYDIAYTAAITNLTAQTT